MTAGAGTAAAAVDRPARPVRVAVVGGGISGLAAAWFLREALGEWAEITVLEQRDVVGGSLRVSDVAGVPVDEGAEALLARRPEAVDLARAAGLGDDVVHPAAVGAGVWSRGTIHPLPPGTVMGVPSAPATLVGLLTDAEVAEAEVTDAEPAHTRITAATSRLTSEPAGTPVDHDASAGMPINGDVSIGRLVTARMGRAVVDRLVEPLLGGVYAGHADELSLDATVPALGQAAREHTTLHAAAQSVRAASAGLDGPVFAGIRGGVGRLATAVARTSGARVHTGTTVRELHRTPAGWQLVTGPVPAPVLVDADAVLLAVPPAPAARLLRGAVDVAASELAAIESASMAVVTLAMPLAGFPPPPSSSGFLVPPADGHTVKAVTYSSVKWPWLGEQAPELVLVRASIGRHRQAEELQREDAELVDIALADLCAATGATGRPLDARVTRWGGALPQYAVGHVTRVDRIRQAVSGIRGLEVCGAIYDGVGVAACIGAARTAAERLAAGTSQQVRMTS